MLAQLKQKFATMQDKIKQKKPRKQNNKNRIPFNRGTKKIDEREEKWKVKRERMID